MGLIDPVKTSTEYIFILLYLTFVPAKVSILMTAKALYQNLTKLLY